MIEQISSSPFFWLALVAFVAFIAVLPTLIALARGADEIMLIVLVNVLGCAVVFGWFIAMYMAIRWPRRGQR
ncbi:superinfection immunity protein [Spirillospora sp. NPDC047279]|uniref:superinfection immunity protein n=1 Tax=Spirillospora sp. NPDC047279 TaxID=3155478 RepID=UPI0033D89341